MKQMSLVGLLVFVSALQAQDKIDIVVSDFDTTHAVLTMFRTIVDISSGLKVEIKYSNDRSLGLEPQLRQHFEYCQQKNCRLMVSGTGGAMFYDSLADEFPDILLVATISPRMPVDWNKTEVHHIILVTEVGGPSSPYLMFNEETVNGSKASAIAVAKICLWSKFLQDSLGYEPSWPQVVERARISTGQEFRTDSNGWGIMQFPPSFANVPIELSNFQAVVSGRIVILDWSTASETNNYGFYIEWSLDKQNWQPIGFVRGYGTVTQPQDYFFTDNPNISGVFYYRLKQVDTDGSYHYSQVISVEVEIIRTNVLLSDKLTQPIRFELYQNHPNPFNPSTTIEYSLPRTGSVSLKIYNLSGEELAVLVDEYKTAGDYSVVWQTDNQPSGVYLYRLITGDKIETKRMVLIK